jgi:hypothetical protein
MKRGNISNQAAFICAIDWRVLMETNFLKSSWRLLFSSGSLKERIRRALPLRKGAKSWLERCWETRFCVVTVGLNELLQKGVEIALGDLVAEFEHFETQGEVSTWLRQTPQVYRVYTADSALLGMDSVTKKHSGWSEKP